MSIYDKVMNALFAGDVIQLPAETNVVSLRRHYNRLCGKLRTEGIRTNRLLHINKLESGGYRAWLAAKPQLEFQLALEEKPDEST